MTISQFLALLAPPLLIVFMFWTFQRLVRRYGYPAGYLLAFIVYWLVWCLLLPAVLLGGTNAVGALFQPFRSPARISLQTHLALWWPVLFPLCFIFLPRRRRLNLPILLVSILLGILIGVTEEILWRGLYFELFPANLWLNLLYPSLAFALWHLAPQSVLTNRLPGGAASFTAFALLLGLTYGMTVIWTGSIAWATIAHVVHDSLGLGGFAYESWLGDRRPQNSALSPHSS